MTVVGFRCFKDSLSFVVLDGDAHMPRIVEAQRLAMPATSRSDQLVWVRKEVQEIIHRTNPTQIAFRCAEPVARTKDLARAEAEGVLQEAARAAGHDPVRRIKKQMRTDLGFERPAKYLDELLVGDLASLPSNQKEAALAALSALSRA